MIEKNTQGLVCWKNSKKRRVLAPYNQSKNISYKKEHDYPKLKFRVWVLSDNGNILQMGLEGIKKVLGCTNQIAKESHYLESWFCEGVSGMRTNVYSLIGDKIQYSLIGDKIRIHRIERMRWMRQGMSISLEVGGSWN